MSKTILKFLEKCGVEKEDAEFVQEKYDHDTGKDKTPLQAARDKVLTAIISAVVLIILSIIGFVAAYFQGILNV